MPNINIDSHSIKDIYTDESVAADLRRINEIIPGEAPRDVVGLSRFFEAMLTSAGRYLARGDANTARRMLGVSVDCAGALFAASGESQDVLFTLEGKALRGPGGPLHHNANVSMWVNAFCLAAALRRDDVLDVLVRYPEQRLRNAPTGEGDAYRFPLAEGMRLFRAGDVAWRSALDEAERLSRPEHLRVAPPALVARYRSLIPIFFAIDAKDQKAFTVACTEAVNAHRSFYSRGKNAQSPPGLLAYQAAGVAALGVDRGLQYEIESAYTPEWLIAGRAP